MVQILADERVCQEKMGVGQRGKGIDITVPFRALAGTCVRLDCRYLWDKKTDREPSGRGGSWNASPPGWVSGSGSGSH